MSAESHREMVRKLAENPDMLDELTEQQILELKESLRPHGIITDANDYHAAISVTNLSEVYMKRFLTTAIIGHLQRMVTQYEPTAIVNKLERDYARKREAATHPNDKARLNEEYKTKRETIVQQHRQIISDFINREYSFNADYHVRSAYETHSPNDIKRVKLDTLKAVKESSLQISNTDTSTDNETALATLTTLKLVNKSLSSVLKSLGQTVKTCPSVNLSNAILELQKYKSELSHYERTLSGQYSHAAWLGVGGAIDPPSGDLFYNLNRYITQHYEQLRMVTDAIYAVKPDTEFSITLHYISRDLEDVKNYIMKHTEEFKSEVFNVSSGGITLLGPWKENRERAEYYNKNTEILREMTKAREDEHKYGAELMKKQVSCKKLQNIATDGIDSDNLAKYQKTMNEIRGFSINPVLTQEEKEKLNKLAKEADDLKADILMPEDAIQVDVWTPGDGDLRKSHFYTKSEDPKENEFKSSGKN